MMTIEDYMKAPYRMEITPDTEEGGYVVSFPELPGSLSTGDTLEEAYVLTTLMLNTHGWKRR